MLFTVEERERVRDRLLAMARADPRIVAGAVVGAAAGKREDRWSDLDLTFGIAAPATVDAVLADWTRDLARDLDAVHLFDLPVRSTVYRVFLLPGNLQLDLSFTPATDFGPAGPDFRLLFGSAGPGAAPAAPRATHLFGLGAHHAVRARFCIERGRSWQAEYWISGLRDQALALAALTRGLNPWYGRGFDRLPREVLEAAEGALVRSTAREELLRALGAALALLLREAGDARATAARLERPLRELLAPQL
jgi:hypothetical protein